MRYFCPNHQFENTILVDATNVEPWNVTNGFAPAPVVPHAGIPTSAGISRADLWFHIRLVC